MSDIETRRKQLRKYFAAGAVVVVLSLIIWIIPSIMIGGFEARISNLQSQTTLTQIESDLLMKLEYSNNYLEIAKISVYEPIAMVVMVIGLLLIAYSFIIRLL